MSEVANTSAPAPVEEVKSADPTAIAATSEIQPLTEPTAESEAPKADATEEAKTDAAPVAGESKNEEGAAPAEEKAVEPITEGQLAYKGPGLVKSLIASKKEFWLSDDAVESQNLDLFLRGEKPEIAYPIAAWATQTGKGLFFFNKKGDTDRTHPGSVLDLYSATDLKKESGHQFGFKLHGHAHTFKAANDNERDGWYISIEKSIELGKASQEEVQASEGYKAELEKLNKVQTPAAAAAATKETPRANSEVEGENADKKKSRSTSRGLFGRKKGKAEDAEQKTADKEPESEEAKTDSEVTAAAATATAAGAAGAAATVPEAVAEDKPAEPTSETAEPAETKTEEAPKPAKRGSIFGKLSGWGGVKSPSKEKDEKEAELTPETPAAEAAAALETADKPAETAEPETALPVVTEPTAESAKEEVTTPNKEKSRFLSNLGFKRGRSVSPSNVPKDAPKVEEASTVPEVAEPAEKAEEPAAETAATEPAEESKTEASANKRQSIFGNLGRRASKAFRGGQVPKQEAAAPATTEATTETAAETTPADATAAVGTETKALEAEAAQSHIGDVVPEAVSVGQSEQSVPTVTASA